MRICEVCGREIIGPAYVALVEGAELIVCADCTRYAKWYRRLRKSDLKPRALRAKAPKKPIMARAVKPGVPTRISELERLELIEDYGRRVKEARERRGLTQEELGRMIGEKASVIKRIEAGELAPDIALARRLEHALGIKLLVKVEEEVKVRASRPPKAVLTLGDVIAMSSSARKREGSREEAEGHSG